MQPWLKTWFLLALTAWPVGMLVLLVHVAVGHGVVAELIGGRFLSLYLSPLAASADSFTMPGAATLIASGTAAPLTAAVGLLLWRATRNSSRFLPRVAGWFCGLGAIAEMGEWTVVPWFAARSRGLDTDWSGVWPACGVPPVVPLVVGLAVLAILSAICLTDARRIVTAQQISPRRRGVSASYWLMASAAALPAFAYVLAFWPYWRPSDLIDAPGLLLIPTAVWVGGLIGMPIARRRGWIDDGATDPAAGTGLRMPDAPAMLAGVGVLLATTIGVAFLFGPATRLRTGFAVRALTPDDYWEVDSRQEVEWAFEGDGTGRLTVRSIALAHTDSEFDQRRVEEADRLGPSQAACDRMLRTVADPIEGVELKGGGAPPDRSQGAWRCAVTIRALQRGLRFVVPEHAAALTVSAPGLATRRYSAEGLSLALSSGSARWVRPERFHGTDALRVRF